MTHLYAVWTSIQVQAAFLCVHATSRQLYRSRCKTTVLPPQSCCLCSRPLTVAQTAHMARNAIEEHSQQTITSLTYMTPSIRK